MRVGERIRISFRVESREYNERWYTDLTAWRIVKISEQDVTGTPPNNQEPPADVVYGENKNVENSVSPDLSKDEAEDDLPF